MGPLSDVPSQTRQNSADPQEVADVVVHSRARAGDEHALGLGPHSTAHIGRMQDAEMSRLDVGTAKFT